jgi:glycerol uptake facilitator-like aquaporin
LLLQAAVVADRNAKLSVFATRPAIYSPLFNFITETMGTVALILLALLIELQVITWVHVHFCA